MLQINNFSFSFHLYKLRNGVDNTCLHYYYSSFKTLIIPQNIHMIKNLSINIETTLTTNKDLYHQRLGESICKTSDKNMYIQNIHLKIKICKTFYNSITRGTEGGREGEVKAI